MRHRIHEATGSRGTETQEIKVEVRPDFLEHQVKAQPIQALAELIWNGLDADATAVNVETENDALDGMSRTAVTDNGHGMPRADAPRRYQHLGGSWTRSGSALNRMLHGQEGRGRFKARALGNVVDWKAVNNNAAIPLRHHRS